MESSRTYVRIAMLSVLLCLFAGAASAQTWAEIFRQKKTQQKYLLQQIAGLQVYIGYAKKGYEIVGDGVHLVKDITSGEFSLHRNFFASLSAVNPKVKNLAAVSEILELGLGIVSATKRWEGFALDGADLAYFSLVKTHLLAQCAFDLQELLTIITSGKLQLSDDERIQRLNNLLMDVREKHEFALSFSVDLERMDSRRKRELKGIEQIRRWYGIE